jgi:hypothetical protein
MGVNIPANYSEDDGIGYLGSNEPAVLLELVLRVDKDLKESVKGIGANEARYLVDLFYSMQRQRIRCNNAAIAMQKAGESNRLIEFFRGQSEMMEKQIAIALDYYTSNLQIGLWARKVKGVGPVITAGLLAHIDITKASTVGSIYSYAGHNPTVVWNKGEKRPWNAKLKTLLWKTQESFVKVSGRPLIEYGHLYKFRKNLETLRNERGDFAPQAAAKIASGIYKRDTDAKAAYESGKLPPAQLHLRATRWAVQIFLSHLHTVWYYLEFEKEPPRPYAFSHLEHSDYMLPPNLEYYPDLTAALKKQFPHGMSIEQWLTKHQRNVDRGQY